MGVLQCRMRGYTVIATASAASWAKGRLDSGAKQKSCEAEDQEQAGLPNGIELALLDGFEWFRAFYKAVLSDWRRGRRGTILAFCGLN